MFRSVISVCIGVFLLCTHVSVGAVAQDDGEQPLASLIGRWKSNGDAFRQPAETIMTWEPALNGQHVRLSYTIKFVNPAGPGGSFEGVAYYDHKGDGTFEAFWADNSGDLHLITATWDDKTLMSDWGREGGKQGRTRYQLADDGTITVTDWIKNRSGEWQQFNENVFERSK